MQGKRGNEYGHILIRAGKRYSMRFTVQNVAVCRQLFNDRVGAKRQHLRTGFTVFIRHQRRNQRAIGINLEGHAGKAAVFIDEPPVLIAGEHFAFLEYGDLSAIGLLFIFEYDGDVTGIHIDGMNVPIQPIAVRGGKFLQVYDLGIGGQRAGSRSVCARGQGRQQIRAFCIRIYADDRVCQMHFIIFEIHFGQGKRFLTEPVYGKMDAAAVGFGSIAAEVLRLGAGRDDECFPDMTDRPFQIIGMPGAIQARRCGKIERRASVDLNRTAGLRFAGILIMIGYFIRQCYGDAVAQIRVERGRARRLNAIADADNLQRLIAQADFGRRRIGQLFQIIDPALNIILSNAA